MGTVSTMWKKEHGGSYTIANNTENAVVIEMIYGEVSMLCLGVQDLACRYSQVLWIHSGQFSAVFDGASLEVIKKMFANKAV